MVHLLVFHIARHGVVASGPLAARLALAIKRSFNEAGSKALAEFSLPRTFLEEVLCHRQRGKDVRPTGVEGKLCKDLRGLRLRETVIHRPVEVIRDLGDLARRYQGADSDQAPIPGGKVRTQPEVPEKYICGVLHYSGCHAAELLADPRRSVRL